MKNFKIIDYSIEYQQKLKLFMKAHNPSFSDTYIDFLVENAWNDKHEDPAIIVVDDNDNIVGEHLFFYTKAMINGVEQSVRWSHDTFLEEEARRYIGLDFVLNINQKKDCFGIGLSDVNKKITKKLKKVYWAPIYSFLIPSSYSVLSGIKRIWGIKPNKRLNRINKIIVNDSIFESINTVKDLKIPNNGYWGGDSGYDIEFVRDEDYLRKRFFQNQVHKYLFYHLLSNSEFDEAYFVVRPIIHKGFKTLLVSDFRYNTTQPKQLQHMLKAIKKLAQKNGCGIIYMITSEHALYQMLKKKFWIRKRPGDFTFSSSFVTKDNYSVMANIADSDGEYHF